MVDGRKDKFIWELLFKIYEGYVLWGVFLVLDVLRFYKRKTKRGKRERDQIGTRSPSG